MPTPETPTLAGEKKKWTPAASGICKWEAAQKSVPAQKKTNDRTDFDRTEHNFYFYCKFTNEGVDRNNKEVSRQDSFYWHSLKSYRNPGRQVSSD